MGWGEGARAAAGRRLVCATLSFVVIAALVDSTGREATAAPKKKPPAAKPKPAPGKGKRKPAAKRKKRVPREFFGVQAYPPLSPGELGALRSARVGTNRVAFYWALVERMQGQRNWSYSDYEVASSARHGVTVLPFFYGSTRWVAAVPSQPPIHTPAALAGWRAFVADAVRRYGPGGEFWRANPDLPYRPITRWQVWNEPSNTHFWHGPPDGGHYAILVRETASAIRSVDPGAKVLLAGILPNRNDPNGIPLPIFLRQIYAVPGIKRSFNGVAVHPYTITPRRAIEAVERARKVILRKRDPKTSLWVTEVGWSTGGTQGERPIITTREGQARNLTRTYRGLLERRRALRLKGIVWFSMRDYTLPGVDLWPQHMGLFDVHKSAKPAWQALSRFTRGQAAAIVEPPAAPAPPPPPPRPCFLVIFC
jgi:polysaccharide biosynthesis protein PslG